MSNESPAGYAGLWLPPDQDPRQNSSTPDGEVANYRAYLEQHRLTLELKCEGLTPEQLATASVPPSNLSLLGLVRHMAAVENHWFVRVLQGQWDQPRLYRSAEDHDLDFNEAVGTQECREDAFTTWHRVISESEAWLATRADDGLGERIQLPNHDDAASVRDILVHLIEEYARHCGHADLLRECIDGRTGV
ncbi:MAG TPA: DinB family protein [Microlunatus sp.]